MRAHLQRFCNPCRPWRLIAGKCTKLKLSENYRLSLYSTELYVLSCIWVYYFNRYEAPQVQALDPEKSMQQSNILFQFHLDHQSRLIVLNNPAGQSLQTCLNSLSTISEQFVTKPSNLSEVPDQEMTMEGTGYV